MSGDTDVRARLLADLNAEQRAAVEHRGGPVMVLAGPGSGKTRVITRRIAVSILDQVARPEQILAVTFTNKAAEEMRQRVRDMLGESEKEPLIATFHSACVRILRIDGHHVGLPRAFSILDAGEARKIIRDGLKKLELPHEPKDIRQAASGISAYKNGRISGDRVGPVLGEYLERCRVLGAVDFDDLLLKVLQLLEEQPEVRERWRRRWRQILVDEYQDTNPVQARIVRHLLSGDSPDLCVVGDPDQSIYGFRNASPRAFEELKEALPGIRTLQLRTNYRSSENIVELCRQLISVSGGLHVDLEAGRGGGTRPRLMLFDSDRDEANWVVQQLRQGGAVLTRTNAQTRLFEDALMKEGIPYRTVGTLRFYDRAEVKDALSWLRVALNRQDLLAFARAAGSMPQGVGQRSIERIVERVEAGDSLQEAVEAAGRGRKAAEALLERIEQVEAAAEQGPRVAVHLILHELGLLEHHRRGEGGQERAENLAELLSAADDHSSDREGSENLLQNIALSSAEDGDPQAQVVLMTAHAAKGREFASVHVCGVEEGLFPHVQATGAEEVEEERRLLYVACSRAEDTLTLTAVERRFVNGQQQEQEVSRLLEPVMPLLEVVDRRWEIDIRREFRRATERRWDRPESRTAAGRSGAGSVGPVRRTPPPRPRGPRLPKEEAKEGAAVLHEKFGPGRIIAVHEGETCDVDVAFESGGTRRLRLDLAPMRSA